MRNFAHRVGPGRHPRRLHLVLPIAAVALASAAPASAAVTGTDDANALAGAILGGPSTGAVLDVGPIDSTTPVYPDGVGDTPLSGFPTGGSTFTVLSSGDAELADDPNDDGGTTGNNELYQNPVRGEANDPTTLGVPFNVPADSNCLSFDYKFLSEEFPEYVNAGFNDAFIAELDQTSWNVSGQVINAPGDFAAPQGDRVSVDSVGPTAVTEADAVGTTYDAATGVLTTKAVAAPGAHVLYLSIFDSGDSILDSAVFVDNVRFTNETPQTCKPPDLFAGQTGVGVAATAKVKGKNALVPVGCNLQVGLTVNCEGTLTLSGSIPKANRLGSERAKQTKFGKAAYSVPPGATQNVPVKLKAKARKALAEKGKLKATAKVVNSSNGATATFKLKLKGKRKP